MKGSGSKPRSRSGHYAAVLAAALAAVACPGARAGDIHDAVRRGDLAAVVALIQARPGVLGAVNELDQNGETPLLLAAAAGNARVAEVLLARGARLEDRDREGFSALHTAVERDRRDVVSLLLARGADANAPARDGRTPLHSAAQAGLVAVGRALLAHGAKPDARERNGGSPLHGAASGGHLGFVELLLARGVPVDTEALRGGGWIGGASALHLAALGGYPEVVAFLLRSGANPHARASHGDTPLHYAAGGESFARDRSPSGHLKPAAGAHVKVAALLIASKADVNSSDNLGRTPLHIAILTRGEVDMVRLLLSHGASTGIADRDGVTAITLAERAGDERLLRLLRGKGLPGSD